MQERRILNFYTALIKNDWNKVESIANSYNGFDLFDAKFKVNEEDEEEISIVKRIIENKSLLDRIEVKASEPSSDTLNIYRLLLQRIKFKKTKSERKKLNNINKKYLKILVTFFDKYNKTALHHLAGIKFSTHENTAKNLPASFANIPPEKSDLYIKAIVDYQRNHAENFEKARQRLLTSANKLLKNYKKLGLKHKIKSLDELPSLLTLLNNKRDSFAESNKSRKKTDQYADLIFKLNLITQKIEQLEKKEDFVNQTDLFHMTPLLYAAKARNIHAFNALKAAGATLSQVKDPAVLQEAMKILNDLMQEKTPATKILTDFKTLLPSVEYVTNNFPDLKEYQTWHCSFINRKDSISKLSTSTLTTFSCCDTPTIKHRQGSPVTHEMPYTFTH